MENIKEANICQTQGFTKVVASTTKRARRSWLLEVVARDPVHAPNPSLRRYVSTCSATAPRAAERKAWLGADAHHSQPAGHSGHPRSRAPVRAVHTRPGCSSPSPAVAVHQENTSILSGRRRDFQPNLLDDPNSVDGAKATMGRLCCF